MICSMRSRCAAVNTGCRYLVTKTESKTRCLPVRMSPCLAVRPNILVTCSFGITTVQPRPGARWPRAFGCARVVFNDGLRVREQAHEAGLPYVTDRAVGLATAKARPGAGVAQDGLAVILQQSLADLNTAYRNFFASVTSAHGRSARWTRGLLYCGLAAGPVFITAFLVEGASRGVPPSRHPVSSAGAAGARGWVQAANFAVTGTLVLAGMPVRGGAPVILRAWHAPGTGFDHAASVLRRRSRLRYRPGDGLPARNTSMSSFNPAAPA